MCDCSIEMPEFYNSATPVARTSHQCTECCRIIERSEIYENVSGKWEGELRKYKTCSDCLDLRSKLEAYDSEYCLCHDNLMDDVSESLSGVSTIPGRFALYRAYALFRRRVKESREANNKP